MITYGYARVSRSTDDGGNTLENQRRRLNLAGVENHHIYEDIITGTVFRRPGLGALLSRLDASDTVVVTALDRLGRDTLESWPETGGFWVRSYTPGNQG